MEWYQKSRVKYSFFWMGGIIVFGFLGGREGWRVEFIKLGWIYEG